MLLATLQILLKASTYSWRVQCYMENQKIKFLSLSQENYVMKIWNLRNLIKSEAKMLWKYQHLPNFFLILDRESFWFKIYYFLTFKWKVHSLIECTFRSQTLLDVLYSYILLRLNFRKFNDFWRISIYDIYILR